MDNKVVIEITPNGWFANILDCGKYKRCVINGQILDKSNPWGYSYDCENLLSEAIIQAIDELENDYA